MTFMIGIEWNEYCVVSFDNQFKFSCAGKNVCVCADFLWNGVNVSAYLMWTKCIKCWNVPRINVKCIKSYGSTRNGIVPNALKYAFHNWTSPECWIHWDWNVINNKKHMFGITNMNSNDTHPQQYLQLVFFLPEKKHICIYFGQKCRFTTFTVQFKFRWMFFRWLFSLLLKTIQLESFHSIFESVGVIFEQKNQHSKGNNWINVLHLNIYPLKSSHSPGFYKCTNCIVKSW